MPLQNTISIELIQSIFDRVDKIWIPEEVEVMQSFLGIGGLEFTGVQHD